MKQVVIQEKKTISVADYAWDVCDTIQQCLTKMEKLVGELPEEVLSDIGVSLSDSASRMDELKTKVESIKQNQQAARAAL